MPGHQNSNDDLVRAEVRQIIRQSEVEAVCDQMRSGRTPRVGQIVDYDVPLQALGLTSTPKPNKPKMPYRFAVEQWHLDEAAVLLRARSKSSPNRAHRTGTGRYEP